MAAAIDIIAIAVIALVVVYIIQSVKPRRVRLRADVLNIITVDLEADAGNEDGTDRKELPPASNVDDEL